MPSGLYAITDPDLLPGKRLVAGVEAALRGGASWIQYRNKRGSDSERLREALDLQACCRNAGRLLIINDDIELARRVAAAGVHLGRGDASLAEARRQLGPQAIVGATCHASLTFAREASDAGASYLAFGRFFTSTTKAEAPPADLAILGQTSGFGLPRVAIGGITLERTTEVVQAGADYIAVVQGLFNTPDIEARAARFVELIQTSARESAS